MKIYLYVCLVYAAFVCSACQCDSKKHVDDDVDETPQQQMPVQRAPGEPCSKDDECAGSYLCRYQICIPDLGKCADKNNASCPGDSYCNSESECIPYGVPATVVNDPTWRRDSPPINVEPHVQCSFNNSVTGAYTDVYTTPIVAELNLDHDTKKIQPSVVITRWIQDNLLGRAGMLQVVDGRTCNEQMNFGGLSDPNPGLNTPAYGSQWAVGDLDNDVSIDGHPEIVGLHVEIDSSAVPNASSPPGNAFPVSVYAIKIVHTSTGHALSLLWHGRDCDTNKHVTFQSNSLSNFGPSIHDLNDDVFPEVVVDELVFDGRTGCLLNKGDTFDAVWGLRGGTNQYNHGIFSTFADVDDDGNAELVRFDRVAEWNRFTQRWVTESWFVPPTLVALKAGHTSLADMGNSSESIFGVTDPIPEVIVASGESVDAGHVRIQSLNGKVIWGPVPVYYTLFDEEGGTGDKPGRGGPPTAADFDGDGCAEFSSAGYDYYTVYDPDCGDPTAAEPSKKPTWRRASCKCQRAPTMASLPAGILWAQPSRDESSNFTGSSVFDFDGDGRAEVVYRDECWARVYEGGTGKVLYSTFAVSGTGNEYPVIADVDGDFSTEIIIPQGQSTASETCDTEDPLFPSAKRPTGGSVSGFTIYREPEDRWVSSRPIWNQHAYSVTNVYDNATVPRLSQWLPNWRTAGLNNFRQNTPGTLTSYNLADFTVTLNEKNLCGSSSRVTPQARVCNRGTNPAPDGVSVEFYIGDDSEPKRTLLCKVKTQGTLDIGVCESVTCQGEFDTDNRNVYVIVDPEGTVKDCHPTNNVGVGTLVLCPEVS